MTGSQASHRGYPMGMTEIFGDLFYVAKAGITESG